MILRYIEQQTGRPISALFHLITGTSTGGIITLGLTCPSEVGTPLCSAAMLLNLYTQHTSQIFKPTWWGNFWRITPVTHRLHHLFFPQYATRPLAALFHQLFGHHTLSQVLTPVLVPAYAIGGSRLKKTHLRLFRSHTKHPRGGEPLPILTRDFYLKDIAMATSAVPTYFSPHWMSRIGKENTHPPEYCLIDGGVAVNDPTLLAYVEARTLFPKRRIHILSLGGGQESAPYAAAHPGRAGGFLSWRHDISNLIVRPSLETHHKILTYLLRQHVKKSSFLRIHPKEQGGFMPWNDTSPEHLKALEACGTHLLQTVYREALQLFLNKLLTQAL